MADDLLSRVTRGEPDACKRFFEDTICQPNHITIEYSARGDWCAYTHRKHVVVPPPCDLTALAICLHEAAHCVEAPCTDRGAHRRTPSGCLECERAAWARACSWVPFDSSMFRRMRKAIGTYRTLPAPASVARAVSTVQLGSDHMKRMQWQMRCEDVARWQREATQIPPLERQWRQRQELVNQWMREANQKTPLELKQERLDRSMRG